MYVVFLVLILIACVLLVLTVLAQSPKGGMAANFGVSNQVMGVRQTTDFLEKFTWGLATSIAVLCLAATMTMPKSGIESSRRNALERSILESGATQQGGNEGLTLPMTTGAGSDAAATGAETTEPTAPATEE
jgi:preprotein translocase subunit SecG